jgi:hypothetical protein
VPSSTSNSKTALVESEADKEKSFSRTIPAGKWGLPLLGALVLFLGCATATEMRWRALGHRPSADAEDLDLWARQRIKASNNSTDTIVIIGKSRAQLDLDVPTIERRYPKATVLQLALRGRGAFAVFEDLVQDEAFRGKILFSLTEPDLSLGDADAQRPAVERSQRAGPDALWNAGLRAQVASRLVLRRSVLHLGRVLRSLYDQTPIHPDFIRVEPDRFTHGDFSRADMEFLFSEIRRIQGRALSYLGNMETPSWPWTDHIRRLDPLIAKLREKGGDVVFVHLPITGISEQFSKRAYPKNRFWDYFARTVQATTIHYRDVPPMTKMRCPDSSHLDEKDAPRFTTVLFKELERREFLWRGAGFW